MKKVTVLTIVPKDIALDLAEKKCIKDFNTLPQINKTTLEVIKDYISENIGYDDYPMACLAKPQDDSVSINDFIPTNNKQSVLFSLKMPEDMIVSVDFKELLDASKNFDNADPDDEFELDYLKEDLTNLLSVGLSDDPNAILFIPFLDYKQCEFYASIGPDFKAGEPVTLPGLSQVNLHELSYFGY